MSIKTILTAFLALSFFAFLQAQDNSNLYFCGTHEGKVDWLIKYQKYGSEFAKSNTTLILPIKVHVVGTDEGSGHFSVTKILNAFCRLQEYKIPVFYIIS